MEIGKPVGSADIPVRSKYADVWKAASLLPDGEALPVTFETLLEAKSFASHCAGRFRAARRGNTVYITQRD